MIFDQMYYFWALAVSKNTHSRVISSVQKHPKNHHALIHTLIFWKALQMETTIRKNLLHLKGGF